jgi:hypothetical protein
MGNNSAESPIIAANIVRDASWYPHRYDAVGDAVQFIQADRAALSAATFLTDEYLPGTNQPTVIGRMAAMALVEQGPSPHFIFHSAYCCSTLLANAFDMPGVSFGLKEPAMLNDISGWRRRGAQPPELVEALKAAVTLLARPQSSGENMIIKPSNVINALGPTLLAAFPESKALLLYTPLENYLASIAKKGMWGRLWVRDLFIKLGKDGLTDYGFSAEDLMQQTDLQIAALGWLAQQRLFAVMAERLGPDRVTTLESEKLLADPFVGMQSLCTFFRLSVDPAILSAHVTRVFNRNAKTGDSFNADSRHAEHIGSSRLHDDEISKIILWAKAVAKAAGQNLQLKSALV